MGRLDPYVAITYIGGQSGILLIMAAVFGFQGGDGEASYALLLDD
jgi:hypothetical protein